MYEFKFGQAMENIRGMVHWFAENEVRKVALEADENHGHTDEFLKKVVALGVGGGMSMSGSDKDSKDASDGLGVSVKGDKGEKTTNRMMILGAEEIAWGDPSLVLNIPGPGLGGPPVQFMGTPEQKERFLGLFKDQSKLHYGAYALTEPGAGSDAKAIECTCKKDGDNYILNGMKSFCTNGWKADWVVVFATVDKSQGRAGHRAFVVEHDTPGFSLVKREEKLGLRASETVQLALEDCAVSVDNLLGGEAYYEGRSEGFKGAMKTFDTTRPMVGAMAVGIARCAYELARDFVKENYDLARPIPRYNGIRAKMAEIERDINAARLLCWNSAWMADLGKPNSKEASMAKVYGAVAAQRATQWAVTVMGAHGVLRKNLVEKAFRDQKVYDIFEGTGQVQRLVISRRLFDHFD